MCPGYGIAEVKLYFLCSVLTCHLKTLFGYDIHGQDWSYNTFDNLMTC